MKRSSPPKTEHSDAFQLLMTGSKKQKQVIIASSSRFVPCPGGCGRHILERDVNNHLDQCIISQQPTLIETNGSSPDHTGGHEKQLAGATPLDLSLGQSKGNAFQHMMKRSAKVFAPSSNPTKVIQQLHLNCDGSLRLTCFPNANTSIPNAEWSQDVQIRALRGSANTDISPSSRLDLTVSTSIPSAPFTKQMVHRHSNLTIPVLKSMLQKSIRRRKPLPSVRVAMELGDKSMADLLRRLPIIALEDSTLHPKLPFLIWIMIAHSKGYHLNESLLIQLYSIVYEMASCHLQDHLMECNDPSEPATWDSYHHPDESRVLDPTDMILWSMLVRAQYGGMRGDILMLHAYARLWKSRFEDEPLVPKGICQQLSNFSLNHTEGLRWVELPTLLHKKAAQQSKARIEALVTRGIECLRFGDTTIEGIDFHCSAIMKSILSNCKHIFAHPESIAKLVSQGGVPPLPEETSDQIEWLETIAKRCMWRYSAGVNRRLPFAYSSTEKKRNESEALEVFWRESGMEATARQFAEVYVKKRLSS